MARGKDKEQYGRDFAPECDFKVYELNGNMGWCANITIGDFYYETDPYKDKQDAIAEQRGCLLAIKEQIEKYLADTLEVKEVDLEQEIEKCLHRHNMLAVGKKDFTDIAKHFANWQEEQMMKDAIPIKIDSGGTCGPFNEGIWIQAILLSSKRINLSDNYKHMIIEVKED